MTAYAFWLFWSFLVPAGRREVGVGVRARAKPDRVVPVGGLAAGPFGASCPRAGRSKKGALLITVK
jgi:hypothetical protein